MDELEVLPDNFPMTPVTKTYRACHPLIEALKFSLAIQLIILALAAFVADEGGSWQICFFAFVAFSSYLASVLILRPKAPTKLDLVLIRAGFIPTLVATYFLADHIWTIRGF